MILKKNIILFLFALYLSLIIGFYFKEDSLGAALSDYMGLLHISEKFKNSFLITFLNYDNLGHRQSPLLYIINSIFFDYGDIFRRLLILHVYLLIPIFFYKCLKIKYEGVPKDYLRLFAGTILLFPTFRSYSIWPDPHLLGSLFFIISIFYYLKTNVNNKTLKYCLLNTLFLALAAYASPNFGLFVIFFYFEFYKKFNFSNKILIISFLNIILSLPFFYYLFYLNINFIFNNNEWNIGQNFYSLNNLSNKIILILSIFLFYLFPFILSNYKNANFKIPEPNIKFFISTIIYIFIIYLFDFSYSYNLTNSGGGFFYNLSHKLFNNNYLLFFLCFFPYLYLIKKFSLDLRNIIIFICLILSNPQITLWQANFSPTIFFIILLLLNGVFHKKTINTKTLIISYSYFFIYLAANIVFRNVLI